MQAEAGERDNKVGGDNFPLCHPLQSHFSISDFFSPVFFHFSLCFCSCCCFYYLSVFLLREPVWKRQLAVAGLCLT